MSGRRFDAGGARIDRARTLSFTFEGRSHQGFVGDTLASALLANGVSVVGRSFKYHRPRGVIAAGAEEPNALMQLETGAHATANVPATRIALYDGLEARAVNCLPSAAFDVGEVNNVLARFFPAGFYYKTFFWPKWEFYEPIIRRAAGLGRAADQPDPDFYDNQFAHCDVLVVGGGPAGLAAAQAASATGARVILAEQDPVLGGSLRWRTGEVDGVSGRDWIARVEAVLRAVPATRVLTNTCAMGYFDHNAIVLVESVGEQFGPREGRELPRQRVWQVRAKHVVLAAGAIERPLVFPGNDRPGVMLASAVTQYHGDFGVACGRAAVFFTNNDSAYASAAAYRSAGGDVAAVVDSREALPQAAQALRAAGVRVISGQVVGTRGSSALRAVRVRRHDGLELTIEGDLLAVSGGWTPTIHLHCQSGGVPRWNEEHACLVPGDSVQHETSAGGCAGAFSLSQALGQGAVAGADAARAAGLSSKGPPSAPLAVSSVSFAIDPLWRVEARGKAFVDFQNDVTADDVALAERENFVSVEHLKRYTALGMGTDQGKTSNINALALMSQIRGQDAAQSGVTRYRFPYQPIALSAFGALNRKEIFRPLRRMPLHERHRALGAVFEEYGTWLRPAYYLRAGETSHQAEQREITAVRTSVGMLEASPLGKIEVIGRDAGAFLDRIYANRMANLGVGKCRYGLMLNELGVVIDDGVCAKLGADHFLVGTTSGGANRIAAWLEEWLQCEWLNFNVVVAPVTQSWGVVTLTGPKAREVLSGAGVEFDLGGEAFPHLTWRSGVVAGIAARVFRVSYTGEISYEINVAPQNMEALWQACLYAGQSFNITPIGIDALMALRTERGFLHVGADTDGTTTALDAGWGRVLSRKDDFIGRRSLMRPADQASDRLNFIGIEPVDATAQLRVGLPIIAKSETKKSDGYVTSAAFSPTLGRWVALGMLENGRARVGEIVSIAGEHGTFEARIAEPGAFDPKGERVHG